MSLLLTLKTKLPGKSKGMRPWSLDLRKALVIQQESEIWNLKLNTDLQMRASLTHILISGICDLERETAYIISLLLISRQYEIISHVFSHCMYGHLWNHRTLLWFPLIMSIPKIMGTQPSLRCQATVISVFNYGLVVHLVYIFICIQGHVSTESVLLYSTNS